MSFPRELCVSPVNIFELPGSLGDVLPAEIEQFTTFCSHNAIDKTTPHCRRAVLSCMANCFGRLNGIQDDPETGLIEAQEYYDSAYILGCLSVHIPLFQTMDDCRFGVHDWVLINITKDAVYLLFHVRGGSHQPGREILANQMRALRREARRYSWPGRLYYKIADRDWHTT